MNPTHKETVYIDVDDEITSIIDKVSSANSKIVAVVLPKRATMLQSSVNMKLLKKAASAAHKQVVLITAEASLLPLAGLAGLHVAKTLQTKPEIPDAAEAIEENSDQNFIDATDPDAEDFDTKSAADKPIGKLAGLPDEPAEEAKKAKPELTPLPIPRAVPEDAAIEIDNTDEDKTEEDSVKDTSKKKLDKKLKVPNFEKFRLRLIIGFGLLIVIIVCFILFSSIFNKATITVYTKTSSQNNTFTVTLDSTATVVNASTSTVPAQIQQSQKSATQQVATTGQKNEGNSASGTVMFTNCSQSSLSITIPAGTGISADNHTFITQSSITLSKSSFDFSRNCTSAPSGDVNVTAQNPGSAYNISATNFTVAGFPGVTASSNNAMAGGTDNILQVVSQADITNAEQKISSADTSSIKSALSSSLQQAGLVPIAGTYTAGQPSITTSSNVGDQASTVTVTEATTYSMFGVKNTYLQTVVNDAINQQINTSQQSIINNGLSSAAFTVVNQSATSAQISFPTTATIGPNFDMQGLKKQIAGKKAGDVRTILDSHPGVTSATVHYSPFWVSTTPNNVSKITITIKKSQ